ncbi:hypothetical protein [Cupriavidus sp. WS]|uniref:hypothetical protein n=1 Tax=Cupriavidus sp. WS TaxID=1312922 RepID=UPI000368B1FD|nr:hypothetical protein [Cupriavidus sp. WS]
MYQQEVTAPIEAADRMADLLPGGLRRNARDDDGRLDREAIGTICTLLVDLIDKRLLRS